jgi:hypothetical protein
MLKNILNLNGAQQLSKKKQKSINGGSGFSGSCFSTGNGSLTLHRCDYIDGDGCICISNESPCPPGTRPSFELC